MAARATFPRCVDNARSWSRGTVLQNGCVEPKHRMWCYGSGSLLCQENQPLDGGPHSTAGRQTKIAMQSLSVSHPLAGPSRTWRCFCGSFSATTSSSFMILPLVQICFYLLIMPLGFRNSRYCDSIQSKLADCFKGSMLISTLVYILRFFSCFWMPVDLDWFLHDRWWSRCLPIQEITHSAIWGCFAEKPTASRSMGWDSVVRLVGQSFSPRQKSFVQWWCTSLDDCWQTSGHQMLSGVTPAKRVLPLSLRSWPQAFQESWNTSHWQKVKGIERLFAKQLPPKDQWPTWQPGQPSDEKACLSVLLAQFAAIAQPSTVLKTPGKVAMHKKKCSGVSFQDDEKMVPLPDVWFPMGRIPESGFVTRRLMVPWPNSYIIQPTTRGGVMGVKMISMSASQQMPLLIRVVTEVYNVLCCCFFHFFFFAASFGWQSQTSQLVRPRPSLHPSKFMVSYTLGG